MAWPGMEHVAGITQPRNTFLAEGMGVNARRLWRHVRTQPHHPAGQLIGQLEGLELQVVPGAREK